MFRSKCTARERKPCFVNEIVTFQVETVESCTSLALSSSIPAVVLEQGWFLSLFSKQNPLGMCSFSTLGCTFKMYVLKLKTESVDFYNNVAEMKNIIILLGLLSSIQAFISTVSVTTKNFGI